MNIRIASLIAAVMMIGLQAKAEGHQPLQVDFNGLIEDTNRDGENIHKQITRQIQNSDEMTKSHDDSTTTGQQPHKIVEAKDYNDQ